jgi:signal transduction histidine kinase
MKRIVIFLFFFVFYSNLYTQDVQINYYRGELNGLSYKHFGGSTLSLGISNDTCYGKVLIKNLDLSVGMFTIQIDNSLLDEFIVFKDSAYQQKIYQGGQKYPSFLDNTGYSFQMPNLNGESVFYFKASSDEQLIVPVKVHYDFLDFIKAEITKRSFYFFYLGIMIVMILYNIFIFWTVKDRTYLRYVFYVGTVLLTQFVISGYADKYFWTNSGKISQFMSSFIPILSGIATVIFSIDFIRTKLYSSTIHKLLNGFLVSYLVALVLLFFGLATWSQYIINFNASCALILIPAAINAIKGGYRPAKYYLIAWMFFLFGVTLYALRNLGLIPFNALTNYAMPIGSAFEAILLSLALADRINILKREKEASQAQAILMMEENQRLIHEQNAILEKEVEARTREITSTNHDLEKTLANLQLTQKQLVESEKLASLGQMTAGIAHEINNPVNFVRSNVQPLKRDVDELIEIISQINPSLPMDDLQSKWNALQQKYKELDVDYLQKEIYQLLQGIDEGSKRTADIVRSLRVFSRMDRDALVLADVNECITSTLMVMKNITSKEVTLSTHLDTSLPQIHCFPGKLNQVLMNLISNAVHATKMEGRSIEERTVEVNTSKENEFIKIVVKDNGTGMKEEVRKKIFDPFFTTKQVGEGTGLGLSIVLGIVQEHGGEIQIDSEWNKGTSFTILLPINANHSNL